MRNTRWLYVLAAIIIAIGLGLVGRSLYKIHLRSSLLKKSTEEPYVSPELQATRASDEKALELGQGDSAEVAKSLKRYGEQNLPKSKEFILKYLESDDKVIRAAAIEAIGAYPDAELSIFKKALDDSDEDYRLSAIRGMAKRADETRIGLLEEHSQKQKMTAREKSESYLALIRMHKTSSGKGKYRDLVLSLSGKDEAIEQSVRLQLYELLPADDFLMAMAYQDVMKDAPSGTVTASLQYLAGYDKENLKQKVEGFPIHKSESYQIALIDFLFLNCPNSWSLVSEKLLASEIVSEKSKAYLKDAEISLKCRLN